VEDVPLSTFVEARSENNPISRRRFGVGKEQFKKIDDFDLKMAQPRP
jgi:hypothetical protein